MKLLMTAMLTIGVLGLALMDPTIHQGTIETDQDRRALCLEQLLDHDQQDTTTGTVIGTLNYTDRWYGGPCSALDHLRTSGWY